MSLQKTPIPAAWENAVKSFEVSLKAGGKSPATIKLRIAEVRRFARGLVTAPSEVTANELLEYLAAGNWSPARRRSVHQSASIFFKFMDRPEIVEVIPIAKQVRPCARPASEHNIFISKSKAPARVQLMIDFASRCGLRRGEVAKIHTSDLIQDLLGYSLLVHGKGGKDRIIPIPDDLAVKVATANGYLFPGKDNGHLSPQRVGDLVGLALPKGVTMHALRHRYATVIYSSCHDIMAVQQLLGHDSPTTTQQYIRINEEELRRAAFLAA